VLRILIQIAFVVGFVGFLLLLYSNLTQNLAQSNLTLDYGVYKSRFAVAIADGPSITAEWRWLQEDSAITAVAWVVMGVIAATAGYTAYRRYREGEIAVVSIAVLAVLVILLIVAPPPDLPQILRDFLFPSSVTRAFFTGIVNTLRVVVMTLFACTILGIFVGIGLLSSNYLVRTVAQIYVEIFRNTPLVVQLFFIYRTFTLLLPRPRDSVCQVDLCGGNNLFAFNALGFSFVQPGFTGSGGLLIVSWLVLFLATLWYVRRWLLKRQDETGQPAAFGVVFVVPVILEFIAAVFGRGGKKLSDQMDMLRNQNPARLAHVVPAMALTTIGAVLIFGGPTLGLINFDHPVLSGPRIQGGYQLSVGFFSLFLGLTLYTAAFVADIVRAGIQAVPYGQIEAARSQGFSGGQVLNLVVLPQALRLIIPPMGNQYVNMGKNSSLGLVVNYVDTFNIARLANNESGQAVPFFTGVMVIYLILSLALSFLTNMINRTTQLRTR
jgi:general L-amino acid transport system permease protein